MRFGKIIFGIILLVLAVLWVVPSMMSVMVFDAGPNPVSNAIFFGMWGIDILLFYGAFHLIVSGVRGK